MKTQINPTDTIMIQHQKIKVCQHPGHCPNHPNKYIVVEHIDSNVTMNTIQQLIDWDSAIVEPIQTSQTIEHFSKPETTMLIDSIKPCDSKYLIPGDTRLASEFVKFPEPLPQTEKQFGGDAIAIGLVCGFMAYMAGNYIVDCLKHDYWGAFFNELKNEWNS